MATPIRHRDKLAGTKSSSAERLRQLALELGHVPSLDEADFVVSEGNRLAHAHILAHQSWPGPLTLILGPPSSGKSHLARIWAGRTGALAPGVGDIEELATLGGRVPLIIEDVDRLPYEEAALFHLINQSMRDRRPLLLTAREPISRWPYRTNDLLSRARLAAAFTVAAADDTQLSQMFVKLFSDRQLVVDPKIISYVIPRMERSPEEVVALVDLMDRLALAQGSAISRSIAAQALALRDQSRANGAEQSHREGDEDE